MAPIEMLSLTVGLSGTAALLDMIGRWRRRRSLCSLASKWGMKYSPLDQLRITPTVAHHFPIVGAANLKVTDVIYGMDNDVYRYVFTAEYTTGALRTKHRRVRAASFAEPRERGRSAIAGAIMLGPEGASLLEQYRKLAPNFRLNTPGDPGEPGMDASGAMQ